MSGGVYRDRNFVFKDSETGHKLFIIVYLDDKIGLAVKTTSNNKRYKNANDHCNVNPVIYYIPEGLVKDCFSKPTYVQIDDIYQFTNIELITKCLAKGVTHHCDLPGHIINGIRNCIKRNKDDIEQKYLVYFK